VTRGARGVLVLEPGRAPRESPARSVEAVDTTGAGDTFTGVMSAWLAAGETLGDAVRAGQAAASIAVTRAGASSSMPSRAEIVAALRERGAR
jgi:ribokinase